MPKPNESYKILCDFEIQIYLSTLARRPHLVLVNKKKQLVIKWILPFQQTTE